MLRVPIARRRPRPGVRADERGYVLAVSAIILVPLLAVAGMATDIGGWYAEGAKMQKAADAAALAAVVWLPDLDTATAVARDVARRNGFDVDDEHIDVVVGQLSNTDLRVTITDDAAPIFFAKFFLDSMTVTREAIATYVLPVPLGSPKNYFGTGNLAPNSYPSEPEGIWASINGWCTPKEQGDPFAPGFMGNWRSTGVACPDTTPNNHHVVPTATVDHYQYVVTLPANRPSSVVIHLYSPAATSVDPDDQNEQKFSTTYTLKAPDNTPFDDKDNPLVDCGSGTSNPRTYRPNENDNDASIFGAVGWSAFCTIPTSAPAGRYLLGVSTAEGELNSNGTNQYSIMASYGGTGAACDSRTDTMCPTVVGRSWISVYASTASTNASFYLASIDAVHAGKQLQITLFDPGEGGNSIQILDPKGNAMPFTWSTTDGAYSGSGSSLDVSGCNYNNPVGPNRSSRCKFNERFVVLLVNLPTDYATRYGTATWWKVRYDFSSSITDRTTWAARIIGDPVHLKN